MKIGIIGRGEWTFKSMELLQEQGHEITFIITAKEAPEYKYTSNDYMDFANLHNIPFLHDPKIDEVKLLSLLQNNNTDVCVSVNYSGIISKKVINLFPLGILNAHGGDLPRYRGNACQAWAIINGENKIGLCIHKMIGGELDSGDIVNKSYLAIDINTKIGEVYYWMENEIPKLMLSSINKLSKDSNDVEKQSKNPQDALRTYPRNPDDGIINWNDTAESIIRLINASSEPFSGAFCTYNEEKMIIWRAKIYNDNENYLGVPGQVAEIKSSGDIIIITGRGKLIIKEISFKEVRGKPAKIIRSIRKRLR